MKETKYTVKYTTSFKKDYKRAIKRGLKIELLEQVVALLAMGEPLPDKNRDHDLSGDWAGQLTQNQIVPKDLYIRSNVDWAAWAFMKIGVPIFTRAKCWKRGGYAAECKC